MRRKIALVHVLGLLFISSCGGTMNGSVRGTGQPIQFTYEQGMSSDTLTAVIDGEQFQGKAVMTGATSTVGTASGAFHTYEVSGYGSSTIFGITTTGSFVATLLGSKGSSIQCRLQYADSSGYTSAGGVGVCRHTDGRIIDIVW